MSGITSPTEEYFKNGQWGWDGTVWRKEGLLFGYNTTVSESVANESLSAGVNYIAGTVVPSGEVWIISAISIWYSGTVPSSIQARVNVNAISITLYTVTTIVSGITYAISGNWVLKAGDYVQMVITGATAGDDGILRYCGYKVKVT